MRALTRLHQGTTQSLNPHQLLRRPENRLKIQMQQQVLLVLQNQREPQHDLRRLVGGHAAARLFVDTARSPLGGCCLRLFLDGKWTSVWIDDLLPVTSKPRREALAFDTKLAFCRCGSLTS